MHRPVLYLHYVKTKKNRIPQPSTFISSKYLLGFRDVENKIRNFYFKDRIFYLEKKWLESL